jgi:hypothetical protein
MAKKIWQWYYVADPINVVSMIGVLPWHSDSGKQATSRAVKRKHKYRIASENNC